MMDPTVVLMELADTEAGVVVMTSSTGSGLFLLLGLVAGGYHLWANRRK